MRNRTRNEDQRERSGRRDASGRRDRSGAREASGQRERRSGQVRVPKIQYRFIKGLEESGVNGEARTGALTMADKIKRYPLDALAVMGSWERFTKTAIEDFKQKRGNDAEHDRQHVAYAVVFSALRDARPAESIGELKQRIEVFAAKRPPVGVDRPRAQPPSHEAPRQQELLARERPIVDRQIDATLDRVRALAAPLRTSIEASARDMILRGEHTPASAREEMAQVVRALHAERSARSTVDALTLAVVARAPTHRDLLNQLWDMPREQGRDIEAEAAQRLERYTDAAALVDIRTDEADAAVRLAIAPSEQAKREAIVLAHAREEAERKADPQRAIWQEVGYELTRDLA